MPWEITGQIGPHAEPGYDGHGWLWELTRENRPARRVFVQIAGTAWAVHDRGGVGLASDTAQAIATEGRSEVERLLNDEEPPRMIGCTTVGCNPIAP
jgi:hypothetical protein